MGLADYILLVLTVAASLAAAVSSIVLTLPKPKYQAARFGFIVSAICFGGLGIVWGANANQSLGLRMAAAAITAAIGAAALVWVLSLIKNPEPDPIPDIALTLVNPASPAAFVLNTSNKIARDVQYWAAIWNLDLPDRTDSLPLPSNTFSFIRPHEGGGPMSYFDSALSLIKPGNRLAGIMYVTCSECARTKSYWVSIKWGEGGWLAEIPASRGNISLVALAKIIPDIAKDPEHFFSDIPETARAPIRPVQ